MAYIRVAVEVVYLVQISYGVIIMSDRSGKT